MGISQFDQRSVENPFASVLGNLVWHAEKIYHLGSAQIYYGVSPAKIIYFRVSSLQNYFFMVSSLER